MRVWFKTAKDGKWVITNRSGVVVIVRFGIVQSNDPTPGSTASIISIYCFRWLLIIGWNRRERKDNT
jgi:hypothetical protein